MALQFAWRDFASFAEMTRVYGSLLLESASKTSKSVVYEETWD